MVKHRRVENIVHLRELAFQAVEQGVTITDPNQSDNPIIYANPSFLQLTGYRLNDVLGRNCRFLHGRDTDPASVAKIDLAVHERRPIRVELCNYRKDGGVFWNEVSVLPVIDSDDQLIKCVHMHTDITQRRQLEEQRCQSHKMKAIGQLAHGISHEFNNFLTVIIAYSDLLLQSCTIDQHAHDCLVEISIAGERATLLTDQLQALSCRKVLAPQVIDLNAMIEGMEAMLRSVLGRNIEISTSLQPGLNHVVAEPSQLAHLLLNLCLNARDAMPHGGTLVLETRNVELLTDYLKSHADAVLGTYVQLSVADSGIGMNSETMQHIFEPFFTTKKSGMGAGLGLSIVHGIVSQCHGHIDVEAELGAGSIFKIALPSSEDAAMANVESPSMPAFPQDQARCSK